MCVYRNIYIYIKRGCVSVGETVGWMRKETDLIFSSVTQSSEVLLVPARLYDTMMLGSE